MRNLIKIAALVFIFLPAILKAADDDKVGRIIGKVVNAVTREPLPGAGVMIVGTQIGAATDVDGEYFLNNVPIGIYTVRVVLIGFRSDAKNDVVIDPIRPVELNFALKENPLDYGQVVVTPDYFAKSPDVELSTQVQSSEEIRRLPGGFEDVVRAISILPGVAQAQNGRNDLIIRGGAPSENLYVVEDIEATNINHFGTQGASGGPLSFINLDYVDQTAFTTGGFGVRYGDKLSSVLNINLRQGRTDRLGGKGTISASQFGIDLEGPLSGKGSFLFSARRSYLDFIFKASGFSFVPEYWDFLGKADYNISNSDKLSVLAVGAVDNVKYFNDSAEDRYDNSRVLGSDQNQAIAGITWRHLLRKGFTNMIFGHNYVDYFYQQNDSLLQPIFRNTSAESEYYIKNELIYQISRSFEITAGIKAQHIKFKSNVFLSDFVTDFGDVISIDNRFNTDASKVSAFTQLSYSRAWFRITLGGRADYFDLIKEKLAAAPRLLSSIKLDQKTNLNLSIGRYFQSPSYIWLVANPVNRGLSFIGVDQYITGIERILWPDTKISLETYYKRYFDYPTSLDRQYLVLVNTGAGFGGSDDGYASFGLDRLAAKGRGRSWGLELFIQKKLSEIPYYGSVSISYGESKFAAIDGVSRPSNWDQRWIINVGGGYIFNAAWEIGTRFRLATGRPYTPFNDDGTRDIAAYNSERLNANHSLDLRLDRRWMFANWMLVTYIDIQNIYNRRLKNVPRWDEREGRVEDEASIGILPTIGISVGF